MKVFIAATLLWQVASEQHVHDAESLMMQEKQALSLVQMRMDYSDIGSGDACEDNIGEWNLCGSKVTGDLGYIDPHGVEILSMKELRYHEVLSINGKLLDMRLTSSEPYVAEDVSQNGRIGCIGTLNIPAPGNVKINFSLVEAGTDIPLSSDTPYKFNFTLMDFARVRSSGQQMEDSVEQIIAGGFANMNNTRLKAVAGPDEEGRYTFVADPKGAVIREPRDLFLDGLTREELASTVNLWYENTNSWEIEFKAVSDVNGKGRTFLWAGKTQHCNVDLECKCLSRTSPREGHVKLDICSAALEKNTGGPQLIRYKRVAKLLDGLSFADLVLTNLTEFITHEPSHNGKKKCLGRLNLKRLTNLTIKFSLMKEGTNQLVPVNDASPVTYDLIFFDIDKGSMSGTHEVVGIRDYSNLDAKFMNQMEDPDGTTWLRGTMLSAPNPDGTDLTKLTSAQIKSSFSVSYTGTSEWTIKLVAENLEGGHHGGRNFFFGGDSCAIQGRHECTCPHGESSESLSC